LKFEKPLNNDEILHAYFFPAGISIGHYRPKLQTAIERD